MGIIRRLAGHLERKLGKLKHEPSEHEGSSTEAASEIPEIAKPISNQRRDSAEKISSIYRGARTKSFEERQEEEKLEQLIHVLKSRFEDPENMRLRHPGMEWAKVEAKIRANKEKQKSLHQMEITGGEPDVVGYKNGEYIFFDCSPESPSGRRNLNYDQALEKAVAMGIIILDRDQYLKKLGKIGKFDMKSWSWVLTPEKIRNPVDKTETSVALGGIRNNYGAYVYGHNPDYHAVHGGFRGWLGV